MRRLVQDRWHAQERRSNIVTKRGMAINAGIFGDGTNLKDRFIDDHEKLSKLVRYWKDMGLKVVLTSGTFDLFHVGHAEYLERAKALGDILIVGVDSDAKVKQRKGPHRPVVPESERIQILSHVRHVDVIVLKGVDDEKNRLIKLVLPDVLVLSESTGHDTVAAEEKSVLCGRIIVLEPQSTTSTSAKVRLMHTTGADSFAKALVPRIHELLASELKEDTTKATRLAEHIPHLIEDTLAHVRDQK
jgi:D-glycero-beta-D-manno-heptose 1-phosphate adenylyltransferase